MLDGSWPFALWTTRFFDLRTCIPGSTLRNLQPVILISHRLMRAPLWWWVCQFKSWDHCTHVRQGTEGHTMRWTRFGHVSENLVRQLRRWTRFGPYISGRSFWGMWLMSPWTRHCSWRVSVQLRRDFSSFSLLFFINYWFQKTRLFIPLIFCYILFFGKNRPWSLFYQWTIGFKTCGILIKTTH